MIIKNFRYNTEHDINNIEVNNNDESKKCLSSEKKNVHCRIKTLTAGLHFFCFPYYSPT